MTTTGTIKIHPASRPGLTHTVEYPNGTTKEWKASTVAARGFDVPAAGRETFKVVNTDGSDSRFVEIFAATLQNGDVLNVDGVDTAVTDVSKSGRDVTFRIDGKRRKASVYRRMTIVG